MHRMLFLLALPFCLTIASPVQDASNIGTDPGDVDYYSDPNAGESVDPYPDFVNIQNDQTGGYDDPDAQEPTSELPYTPGVQVAEEPSGSSATEPDPCQDEDLYCCHRSVVGTLKQSALNGLCFQCTQIPMKCDEQNQHCKSTVHLGYRSCCPLADGGTKSNPDRQCTEVASENGGDEGNEIDRREEIKSNPSTL